MREKWKWEKNENGRKMKMGAEKKQNEHGSKIKHLSKRVEIEGKNKNTSGNSSSCVADNLRL